MKLVLGLVSLTMVMFLFERMRADLVALVVLVLLGLTGLVALRGPVQRLLRQRGDQRHRDDDPGRRTGPHRRAQPARRLAAAARARRRAAPAAADHGRCRPQFVLHAEPVGDGAVPAGRLAPVLAHGLVAVAPAAADRRCHRDGRRADDGRQLAADPAQRPVGRRQRQPALRRRDARAAAHVRAAADRPGAARRAACCISSSSATSCCARTTSPTRA